MIRDMEKVWRERQELRAVLGDIADMAEDARGCPHCHETASSICVRIGRLCREALCLDERGEPQEETK